MVSSGGGAGRGSPEPDGAEERGGALGGSPQGVGAGGAINEVTTIRGGNVLGQISNESNSNAIDSLAVGILLFHAVWSYVSEFRENEKKCCPLSSELCRRGQRRILFFLVSGSSTEVSHERGGEKGVLVVVAGKSLVTTEKGGDATPSVFRFG